MNPGLQFRKAVESKKVALLIGIGLVVLFAGAVVFGMNATHGMPLAERKTVKATFDDLAGLNEGDDVRIASTRVGFVEDLHMEQGRAIAVLKLDDPNTKVYRNADATNASVGARSALGQKFVDLNPGSSNAGELRNGAVIPERDTRGAQEITDLFNAFDKPTRKAAGTTLRELGGGMDGHGQDLADSMRHSPQTLPDLGTVSKSFGAGGGSDLVAMLQSADTLSSRFAGRQDELAGLTGQLGDTLDSVAPNGGGPMRAALQRSPQTLREAKSALTALSDPLRETRDAAAELRPGAEALSAATPNLRGALREGVRPLDKVPGVTGPAKPALGELTAVMRDARPVSARLVDTTNKAATPLGVLAPYNAEVSNFFSYATSALSQGDTAGNWLRIYLVPRLESVSGALPVKDPTTSRNAYPAPGEAPTNSAASPILGGRR
jgi:phospholipid/cholesterol/gamma-HCH transport system substrate-binding protein